jgi:hypothetical protein
MPVDQYGKPVPKFLVGLPDIGDIELLYADEELDEIIEKIDKLDWWETRDGYLLADGDLVTELVVSELVWFLEDLHIKLKPDELVLHVPQIFHRWSIEDGFYHA